MTIVDANTALLLKTLNGHTSTVNAVKAIDSQTIASGSSDYTIRIWNLATGTCTFSLTGHTNYVNGLEYLSTGYLVYDLLVYSTISILYNNSKIE